MYVKIENEHGDEQVFRLPPNDELEIDCIGENWPRWATWLCRAFYVVVGLIVLGLLWKCWG